MHFAAASDGAARGAGIAGAFRPGDQVSVPVVLVARLPHSVPAVPVDPAVPSDLAEPGPAVVADLDQWRVLAAVVQVVAAAQWVLAAVVQAVAAGRVAVDRAVVAAAAGAAEVAVVAVVPSGSMAL